MFTALAAAAVMSLGSTSYCLSGTMADGTQVRQRSVAVNNLPLGTHIELVKPKSFYGIRRFVVRDRIGYGSQIDFWHRDCSKSVKWGRKKVVIRVIKKAR